MALRVAGGAGLSAKALDVISAGELYVDVILSGFDSWPQPGKEAFAKGFRREIGGGTAITARGLAALGMRTGVLGLVGQDSGEWVRDQLAARGVDTQGIAFDKEEPTGITVVATTHEDRAFLSYAGANKHLLPLLMEQAESRRLSYARHVHLACAPEPSALKGLLAAIHENHCTVSLDAGWHEDWLSDANALSALREIDVFFPNEVEARCMTGEDAPKRMLEFFRSAGIKRVALKLGPQGAALLSDGNIVFAAAPPVTPVDTTGAGDCFDAGFLYAWLSGMSPEVCLRTANICGALSTQAYGGIEAFPALRQVQNELAGENSCGR